MQIKLPDLLTVDERIASNPVRQIGELGAERSGVLWPYTHKRVHGFTFLPSEDGDPILLVPKTRATFDGHARVLQAAIDDTSSTADLSGATWLRHPLINGRADVRNPDQDNQEVLDSWSDAFSFVQEDPAQGIIGLRGPQIGAVHAVHAHWAVSNAPATIVMPTGTGKTETMLSILVSALCPRLLVVVPTDPLRTQLARKFLTLGILKAPGCSVLHSEARYPIVCMLQHIPQSAEEVNQIFGRSHVIITTSSIAGQCPEAVQERMALLCPYLFIDEAHHAEAPTWSSFKLRFQDRRIVQFTATPFREDGKPLDGDIIFKYPLKKAQEEGYFTPIRFKPVVEFNRTRSDEAIANRAIDQLRADADKGHIVMARVDSLARASEVFELYSQYPEFNPVQLHTGITSSRRRDAIRHQIITGESRIVVCVDMLGEGFDLPELKIAAFHDIRKTLPVTLQLAGRFTRARPDLGDATFIANTADVDVQDELRKLYTRDPDWNALLPELSDRMIGEQISLQEFLRGFAEFATEIPLRTVRPAISAVVYKTTCPNWTPEDYRAGIPGLNSCEQVHGAINHAAHTLVVVTARRVHLDWTDVESLHDWQWELYVVVWSPEQDLLFINSSANAGEYKALAQAVAGETATLISGQQVFRAFAGVNRLRLQNVGLSEQLGRNVRYTGRMGADVEPALTEAQRGRARKAVLSGSGYEDGQKTTVGASRKGRIWSHRRDRVDRLVAWCRKVGHKLLDEQIDPDEVLRGTLSAEIVGARPRKMPIAIDWPEDIYTCLESQWSVIIDGDIMSLSEVGLELVSPAVDGPIRFAVFSESRHADLELELFDQAGTPNYRFVCRDRAGIQVRSGERGEPMDAVEFFYDRPPIIWFSDGSSLDGNQHVELRSPCPPYDVSRIQAWDWSGINIRKESQGQGKDPESIQARVIRDLRTRDYTVIMDDDGAGEAADVVAIRLRGTATAPSSIDVEFYHCKYSLRHTPGGRVDDLYVVCGQAQKSISWMSSPDKRIDLFTHLLRRGAHYLEANGASRYEVGDDEALHMIREVSRLCPVSLSVFVVQPGVSKARMTRDQLLLLGVTENYLTETYQLAFGVIASD
jgi:superfamily II DNA or RNA helicase